MRRSRLIALGLVLLLALPAVVEATAYSPWRYAFTKTVLGAQRDACARSGILDTARNESLLEVYDYNGGGTHCLYDPAYLPSGYIGVRAAGYRDGAYCGTTSWYYSNTSSWYWWVRQALCSNPAGTQEFDTIAYGRLFDGSQYWSTPGYVSPKQNY